MLVVFAKAPQRQNSKIMLCCMINGTMEQEAFNFNLKKPSTHPTHTSPRRETIIEEIA